MAKLARVAPAWSTLTFDTVAAPSGETVRNPAPPVSVNVRFTATAVTPEAGTPPRPVTCTTLVSRAASLPGPARPVPSRLSTRRAGVAADTYRPAFDEVAGVKYPKTSMTRSARFCW